MEVAPAWRSHAGDGERLKKCFVSVFFFRYFYFYGSIFYFIFLNGVMHVET